jgi:hypothetical protein
VALKYEPQLAAAKARSDTNEVRRIQKLIREKSDNPKVNK